MPRQSAIRLEHRSTLVDLVRQCRGAGASASYTIHCCRRTENQSSVYFLTSTANKAWFEDLERRGWWKVEIDLDGGSDHLRQWEGATALTYPLQWTKQHSALALLVGPEASDQCRDTPDLAVLWCADEAVFQRLASMSLRLGCDRLQYSTISASDESPPAHLLRAERASFFVIDSALEDPRTRVYVPQADGRLYVEWGTQHPLVELFQEGEGGEAVVFMDGQGLRARAQRVHLPPWADIYQLTSFSLADFDTDEQWRAIDASPREFVVELRLSPSHTRREPQLWLVSATEQPRIERLLRAIPEPDLDTLQFSAQEGPEGQRWLIIRERHTGKGREYIDFEGTQLGPWAGYPNLMLPVDKDLEPHLRKDRYRSLFKLRPGTITIFWQALEGRRLIHVKERSFRPLREFVDYIVGVEGETLNDIVGNTAFSFQKYRYSQPAAQPRKSRPKKKSAPSEEAPPQWEVVPEKRDSPPTKPREESHLPEPEVKLNTPEAKPHIEISALEILEAELETALFTKGQNVERWMELAQTKSTLAKHAEAAVCLIEASWMCADPAAAEEIDTAIVEALEEALELNSLTPAARKNRIKGKIAQADCDPSWIWLWIIHGARDLAGAAQDSVTRQWIAQGHRLLKERKSSLRKKERWTLWGRLVSVNRDAVEQTRVREELLDELNRHGLRPMDVPHFVQDRIYRSRLLDEGSVDGGLEARAALRILERIEADLSNARDEALRQISDAVLAYGLERIGDSARAAHRRQLASESFENSSGLTGIERAWIALYLGASLEVSATGSGREWLNRHERLFKQHKSGDLYSSELETLQRHILERSSSDSPSQFLDSENFRSLYPASQKYTRGQAIRQDIESMVKRGDFERVLEHLQSLAQRASKREINLETRELAWLLQYVVVMNMRRIGRAAEGVEILQKFEEGRIDPQEDSMGGFYPTLYILTLGEGYMELGQESRGMDLVCGAVRQAWAGEQRLQWLDHLDMISAALNAIEMAPLEHRIDAVGEVLQSLFLDRKHPAGVDRPQYRPIKLRLLDHCVEVSLSKEKLSLKRYKNYLDEDEFHIRQKIITDRIE